MSKPVALRAKRKRSGYVSASAHRENAAFERAVRATVEPLERRVMLSAVLTATAAGPTDIRLNWENDFGANAPILVERSTDGTNFTPLTTVGAGTYTYDDASVSAGRTYLYRVDSPPSGSSVQTSVVASAKAGPAGNDWALVDTVAVPVGGSSVSAHVALTSGANYQLRASGDFYLGGPTGRADAEYSYSAATGFSNAYDYAFQYGIGVNDTSTGSAKFPYWGTYNPAHDYQADVVGAGATLSFDFHDDYYGDNVADDAAHPLQVQIWAHLPAAPSDLVAVANGSGNAALTWQNNATDQTGFDLQRSDDGGATFHTVATLGASATGYTDSGLTVGQTYYYRVAAFDAAGDGPFSNVAQTGTTNTSATISGHVYQTTVGGQHLAPLAGVRVYVDEAGTGALQSGEPAATSAADGSYTIQVPLSSGDTPTYPLRVDLGGLGATDTTEPSGGSYQVSLSAGATVTGEDFGIYLAQAPTFDSTPPQTAHVNPYAQTPDPGGVAWQPGDLFLATSGAGNLTPGNPGNVAPGIERMHQDGSPVTSGAPDGSAQAEYLSEDEDTSTRGNWGGTYGADGYALFGTSDLSLPAYATLTALNATATRYADQDGNALAMQTAPAATTHVAAAYTAAKSFTLDLNLTDGQAHRVALYLADYESAGIQETVSIADAKSGTVLGTYALPDGAMGSHLDGYLAWNLSGHVTITVTATGATGGCAASALLFDPVRTRYLSFGLISTPTGMAFDAQGDLFATNFENGAFSDAATVAQFGANGKFGQYLDPTESPVFSGPESAVFDAVGDLYVSNVGLDGSGGKVGGFGIYKFNPQGQLMEVLFSPQRVDWMDLAPDQHTLVFTTEGNTVYQADTNTGQVSQTRFATIPPPPPNAPANVAYAVRFLPNGGTTVIGDDGQDHTAVMLLADSAHVLALGPDGSGNMVVVKTYDATDPEDPDHAQVNGWFAMNLDPNGTSFWSAGGGSDPDTATSSTVVEFDIRTGTVQQAFDVGYPVLGITVYGERTAAVQQPTPPVQYVAHATDPNGNPVVYSLLDPTNGATIEASSGLLTWTPPGPGTYSFTIVAADEAFPQLRTQQTFTVTVDDVVGDNENPVISTPATLSPATVGLQYTNRVAASDADGDRLTYALVSSPGFTINPDTGGIAWLPTAQDQAAGQGTLTVRVTDSRGGSAQRTFTVPVQQPVPGNQPPHFDGSQALPDATVGQLWQPPPPAATLAASDPDGDPITFVPISMPAGMSIVPSGSQAGVMTWTPTPDEVGVQQFVMGVSDGFGNIIEKTFTVVVHPAPLSIGGIDVQQAAPDTLRLTAVMGDPSMLKSPGLKFTWAAAPNGLPDPLVKAGEDPHADSVDIVFAATGSYQFNVSATDANGDTASYTQTITLAQLPTQVVVTPPAFGIAPGQQQALAAKVYDQFGLAMATQPAVTWSILQSGSGGGSVNATSGLYTAGPSTGTDVVQASVASGGLAVTGDATALVAGGNALVGTATGGMVVTEGDDVSYSGVGDHVGYLAVFYDPRSGAQASDYTATVNWGDGTSSPAAQVTVALDSDPSLPANMAGHLFTVSASHTYAGVGIYPFSVTVNGPNNSSATITPRPGQGISVQPAGIEIAAIPIRPMASRLFSGEVAEFTDDSTAGNINQFQATIYWGDGASSAATLSGSNGTYQVSGSHTYGAAGVVDNPRVDVYEAGTPPNGPALTLRGSTPLDITVLPASLLPPEGLTVTGVSQSQIEVQWHAEANDPTVKFLLLRTNPDGSTTILPDQSGGQLLINDTKFFDPDTNAPPLATGARYGYQAIAVDQWGNQSAPSPIVFGQTWSAAARPTGLAATLNAEGGVHLTWNTTADPTVSGWDVLRAPADNPTDFTSLLNGGEVAVASYDDDTVAGAAPGSASRPTYVYEVVAVQHLGERSQPSAAVSIQIAAAPTAPGAPTNLVTGDAGDYLGTFRIGLQWNAPAGFSGLGYDVYRMSKEQLAADNNQFVTDSTTLIGSSNDTGYTDDRTTTADLYYYEVKAVAATAAGQEISSPASNEASVDTTLQTTAPQAPTGLNAPADAITASQVQLFWTDNSVNEAGFEIRRKPGGAPDSQYQLVGRSTQDDAQFADATVQAGASYDYEVLAYNFGTNSSVVYSTPDPLLNVQTPKIGSAPAAPTNLQENTDPAATTWDQITLTWSASSPSNDVAGYNVYRQQPDGAWLLLNDQPVAGTSYTDANLTPGTYDYQVTAVSSTGGGQSAPLTGSFSTAAPAASLLPVAVIASPAAFSGINVDFSSGVSTDGRIQTLTPVKVVVADPNGYSLAWTLVLRPDGQAAGTGGNDIPLASGSGPAGSVDDPAGQTVCVLDPTLFANGNYQLVLTAIDQNTSTGKPGVSVATTEVSLYSQTKLGNLTVPVTDMQYTTPGGQQITVQRVYDSQNANVLGDVGYGWSLQTAQTKVTTTAQNSPDYGGVAFAPGDVVYVTLPDGGQHAFQFFPVPTNYSNTIGNPYDPAYAASGDWVQFVCVDGSNATLSVPGDIHDSLDNRVTLSYDDKAKVFYGGSIDGNGGAFGYNPGTTQFGDQYTLTTADGNVYTIAASTGKLLSTKDPNGNVVTYRPDSITTSGGVSLAFTRNQDGTIASIDLKAADGAGLGTVSYSYTLDAGGQPDGQLIASSRSDNINYQYQYDTAPGMSHYLTQVSTGGVTTLTAAYDALGRLTSLTDAYGRQASTGVTSSDGSAASQLVTNLSDPNSPPATPAGTQNIFDANGNVSRSIQTVTDASGNLLGYTVTAHDYAYATAGIADEVSDIFSTTPGSAKPAGNTEQNALIVQTDYAPFFIPGPDTSGLRYSQAPSQPLSQTAYYFLQTAGSPGDIGLPASQTQYVGDGSTRVTNYSNYVDGKPGKVTVTVNRGSSSQVVSSTDNYYDADGNLIYTFDALGQGTQYVYSDGTGNLPKGLLLSTWKVTGEQTLTDNDPNTNPTQVVRLSLNTYYTSADVAGGLFGAAYGKLRASTDASGRLTYYAYDALGDPIDQYTLWTDPAGVRPSLWVGTTNVYSDFGVQTGTYQGEFVPGATAGVLDLSASGAQDHGFIVDAPVAGFNGGQPLQTGATGYDAQGRVIASTDQYGATTHTTYDGVGNVVQTTNPDGTQVLSVYDPMGRAVWQTDPFLPGGPAPVLATHTVYDSAGRVTETDRYQGTDIAFTNNAQWPVQTTFVQSQGTLISSTHTYYDQQGRVVESDDASGLRTGTVYYPDGQVQYTGPLNASAAIGGGSSGVFATSDFASYTTSLYNQFDASTGLPYSGMLYDRTIDQNGHHTDTYQDALGRTIFTIYDDGSFTQMLYGVGNQPVAGHVVSGQTIDGYQTTSIDQLGQATDSFYDRSGRLTDVYQPPVADADPNSPTHGQTVAPHWHYTYDAAGNELSQTDPKGNVTSWTYDERGNKLTHSLPGNQRESWTYDQYNRVVTHTDLNGNTAWEVYANAPQWPGLQGLDAGRLIAEYRYVGAFTPPSTQTSPDSTNWAERTVYVYDDGTTDPSTGYSLPNAERFGLGRVAEVQEWTKSGSMETETDFTHTMYDPVTGQPASIASNEGTVNYAYDPATGRKVRMWTGTDASNAPDDTAYAYDMQGRLTDVYTLVLKGMRYATYGAVDPATHNPTFTGTSLDTHYTYDLASNLKTESQPDNTTTTYTYDDLNRLTDLATQNTSTNEPVFAEHYDLRADGMRSDVTDTRYNSDGSVFSQTKVNWSYDAVDRLTSEALTVLAGGSNAPAAYTDVFKFDLDGNRVEEDITGAQNATVTYTYNANNELGTETRIGDGAYSTTDGYDNAGELTSQVRTSTNAETDSYRWDLRGRMATATVNGVTTTYTYDSDGVRISETTGAAATYYLNDPSNPTGYTKAVEESGTRGGTPSRSYILGVQVEGQADATNGALFLLHDGHGNTRALLNVSGGVVEQYNDDAYGTLLASTGAQSNAASALTPWLQPDGLYDPASGWDYSLARWRDGFHFVSMDPTLIAVADLADANRYVYVGGDSVNGLDPSGRIAAVDTVTDAAEELSLESQATVSLPRIIIQATAVALIAGIVAGGGLVYTQNGSPVTPAYQLAVQSQLQQNPVAAGQAYQQAVQTAVASGKYTSQQAKGLPIFWVFQSITPGNYQNDFQAMAGVGTRGGASAPDVLNYLPGGRAINGPGVLTYAASIGMTPTATMSRDEYPFASTSEGGATPWLRLALVPRTEQSRQGGDLSSFYAANSPGYATPFRFLVALVP